MTRVLVCGGRNYNDRERVYAVLDKQGQAGQRSTRRASPSLAMVNAPSRHRQQTTPCDARAIPQIRGRHSQSAHKEGNRMSDAVSGTVLRDILAGCEGVTAGPWHLYDVGDQPSLCPADAKGTSLLTIVDEAEHGSFAAFHSNQDAEHIARIDPQTIASIVSELIARREADVWQHETPFITEVSQPDGKKYVSVAVHSFEAMHDASALIIAAFKRAGVE
jgi:hypothetical protein